MLLLSFLLNTAQSITVSGTVLSSGEPVAGSDVYLFNQQGSAERTTADEEGQFSFADISGQGFRLLAITPTASNAVPKYYPEHAVYCQASPIYSAEDQILSFDLPQGVELSGYANLAETPEEGALLIAVPLEPYSGQMRGAYTEDDGYFAIKGLPKDHDWRIAVEAEGLPEQWFGGEYEEEESPVLSISENLSLGTFELLEGIYLGGTIQSGDTNIPNATVTVYSNSQITNISSDEEGHFWLSGLPPGEVTAWASMDGYATTYYPSFDRPTEFIPVLEEGEEFLSLDIEAPLESTLSVQLLDAWTEEPITGASVLLYNDNRTVGRGEPVDDFGVATIHGLYGGEYNLQYYAENDGYFSDFYRDDSGEEIWISIAEQEDQELTIYLEPSTQLAGTVLDEHNEPVAGFTLLLSQSTSQKRARSDSNGSFQFSGLNREEWLFSAEYLPLCSNDMGYILAEDTPDQLNLAENADLIVNVYRDHDQDQMPSFWEEEMGLDPWRNDAEEDLDQDGASNLEEYKLGSNPADSTDRPYTNERCGCSDSKGAATLAFLLLGFRRRV